jgi:hypothetical protein
LRRVQQRGLLIHALIEADGPLAIEEIAERCRIAREDALRILGDLVRENMVVEVESSPGGAGVQYSLGSRWIRDAERFAGASDPIARRAGRLTVDSPASIAFHEQMIHGYTPPPDKRFLAILQCCVRRPFSTSPSHASMRRAIAAATGWDPIKDFADCPVHVVVLASAIGPVPYELEDVYPANARAPGVKHLSPAVYDQVRPVLAERMAEYLIAHRDSYDRVAAFTEGRYGEVMGDARAIVTSRLGEEAAFPILPYTDGPQVIRMGRSTPRTYWQRYWIQLYAEIVDWLEPGARAGAEDRLRELGVTYE